MMVAVSPVQREIMFLVSARESNIGREACKV